MEMKAIGDLLEWVGCLHFRLRRRQGRLFLQISKGQGSIILGFFFRYHPDRERQYFFCLGSLDTVDAAIAGRGWTGIVTVMRVAR